MINDLLKLFIPGTIAFVVGIILTPFVTHYLYKHKMWKKRAGKISYDGTATPLFNELHKHKEVGTPRMGGIVIWASVIITILGFWLVSKVFPTDITEKFVFLSRGQTWIPLFTLVLGAVVGLIDDYMEVKGTSDHIASGLSIRKRLLIVGLIALGSALWFFYKLDVSSIGLAGGRDLALGYLFIPFFMLVVMALYTGGVIDGIDGLSGGVFAAMFSAYGGIAFFQNQLDLAAFCSVLVGSILAFLWFNIPPARFYMSETGSMALTITLAIVAFLTDATVGGHGVLVLPIIAFPLFITSASVLIQMLSRKFRSGKKVFLIAPLHHHFEALGWPAYKVTMRYWIISTILAAIGLILALIGTV
jgi:phospho-N-acetylmuramoyl-pentapeptide-transferase